MERIPRPLRKLFLLVKEAFSEWKDDNASRLAAALSYHTAFSLAPLLVVILAIAGVFWGAEAVHSQFLGEIRNLIGEDGAQFVADLLSSASQGDKDVVAMIIGTSLLLLGATGVFGNLHEALNAIWDVPKEQVATGVGALARGRMLSFGMLLTVGFLLLVSLVISTGVSAMDEFVRGLLPSFQFVTEAINFVVSFGLTTVLFALIYKFLPDAEIEWPDVWIGAAITAVLFSVGKFVIGLYLGNSGLTSTYGAAASFAIILVWIYYSAQIFFFGAELTQVYANRYGSRIGFAAAPAAEAEQADSDPLEAADATSQAGATVNNGWVMPAASDRLEESARPGVQEELLIAHYDDPSPVQPAPEDSTVVRKWIGVGGVLMAAGFIVSRWLSHRGKQTSQDQATQS